MFVTYTVLLLGSLLYICICSYAANYRQTSHLSLQWTYWSLRCSWCITCRRCSNHIFILDLTPGFNGFGKNNCTRKRESFKFWDLLHLILGILRHYHSLPAYLIPTCICYTKISEDVSSREGRRRPIISDILSMTERAVEFANIIRIMPNEMEISSFWHNLRHWKCRHVGAISVTGFTGSC